MLASLRFALMSVWSGLGRVTDVSVFCSIRGKKFLTSWETIMHAGNSMLASMFKGKFKCTTDEDGFAFIDRDGE